MPDILIRGKDLLLPERSSEILEVFVFSDGTIQYGKHYGFAIELPEHGDLIDRDALKHKFCTHCDGYEYDTGACVDGDQDCMDAKIIMTAPVIVPANKEETE